MLIFALICILLKNITSESSMIASCFWEVFHSRAFLEFSSFEKKSLIRALHIVRFLLMLHCWFNFRLSLSYPQQQRPCPPSWNLKSSKINSKNSGRGKHATYKNVINSIPKQG